MLSTESGAAAWLGTRLRRPARLLRLPPEVVRHMTDGDQEGLQEWILGTSLAPPVYCSYDRESGLLFIKNPQY